MTRRVADYKRQQAAGRRVLHAMALAGESPAGGPRLRPRPEGKAELLEAIQANLRKTYPLTLVRREGLRRIVTSAYYTLSPESCERLQAILRRSDPALPRPEDEEGPSR